MVLKWIHRNIEAFGGDPNHVTVWGHSSGSVICHLLTLIPATRGLIHKAILQGAVFTGYCPDLLYSVGFKNGFHIASRLGMESNGPVKVLKFLRYTPGEELIAWRLPINTNHSNDNKESICQSIFCPDSMIPESTFEVLASNIREYGPVFDALYTKDPVIPLPLAELLENDTNIPIIIEYVRHEKSHLFQEFVELKNNISMNYETISSPLDTRRKHFIHLTDKFIDKTYKYFDKHVDSMVRNLLPLKHPGTFPDIMRMMRKFYFDNHPINEGSVWNLINSVTDLYFINQNRKAIDNRNKYANTPTCVYNFSYMGDVPTIYHSETRPQPLKGTTILLPFRYLELTNQCPQEGSKDRIMMERFLRMWFNFAAIGDPTPMLDPQIITSTWTPSNKQTLHYLDIGDQLITCSDKDSRSRKIHEEISHLLIY
ncbi:hypothetical protein QAD02_001099 [Eretmocerus hayati]|uniref:Uncharacterized protein n=1 Tax=Eretmocerus hayati TaxID=131215 RepID=A0ACC2NJV4_9HYME|nr:hypothetical protein QAD02_001099 [Eretmocerus hayati]